MYSTFSKDCVGICISYTFSQVHTCCVQQASFRLYLVSFQRELLPCLFFQTFPIASSIKSSLTFCEFSTSTFAFFNGSCYLVSIVFNNSAVTLLYLHFLLTPSLYKTLYTVLSLKKNMQKAQLYACFMQILNIM